MGTVLIHQAALGDSVLLWPILRSLGNVVFVAPWSKARLAERWIPGVRAVDGESPEWSRLFVGGGDCEAGEGVRQVLRDADGVVSFVSDGSDTWARNVAALRGPHEISYLNTKPADSNDTHMLARFSRQLGIEPVQPSMRANPDGPVVIHPGSGGRDKCWAPERFDALIDHLNAIGRPVVVVLGEVERERLDPAWPRLWGGKCDVCEPPDLIEMSLVIARASVFVGNDSGPTHLAAQLGVPTVALFGPTNPRIWAPTGPAVRVLWSGELSPMDWLDVGSVIEAIA